MAITVTLPKVNTTEGARGINSALVAEAKAAIEDYKTKITSQMTELKSNLDYSTSFFGEHQSGVQTYVNKVMDALGVVLSQLDNFSTSIDTAIENYAAQDASLNEALSSATSDSQAV